jgi:twinkle protein
VAQKLRFPDKTFTWVGRPKVAALFLEHLWRGKGGKRLVVTEGEIDALSVLQAFGCKWDVVSVKNGSAGAAQDLLASWEFVSAYKEVVLWFDADDPGRKALAKCLPLFSPGTAKSVAAPEGCKDANDVLKNLGAANVVQAVYSAREYRPDGILRAAELWDQALAVYNGTNVQSYALPFPELQEKLLGYRPGELWVVCAGSGIGKSTFIRELAWHLKKEHKVKIGYIALEENVTRTVIGFMGLHLNMPLHLAPQSIPIDQFEAAFKAVSGDDTLILHDHWGSMDMDNLLSRMQYMVKAMGVQVIILDHISIVISGLGLDDERKGIDVLMTRLRSLCEETGAGLICISHIRKAPSSQKAAEDGGRISLSDLRGSAALYQLSDAVLALRRNPRSKKNSDVTQIEVLKNRFSGTTGTADYLKYDRESGRMILTCEEDFEEDAEQKTSSRSSDF